MREEDQNNGEKDCLDWSALETTNEVIYSSTENKDMGGKSLEMDAEKTKC